MAFNISGFKKQIFKFKNKNAFRGMCGCRLGTIFITGIYFNLLQITIFAVSRFLYFTLHLFSFLWQISFCCVCSALFLFVCFLEALFCKCSVKTRFSEKTKTGGFQNKLSRAVVQKDHTKDFVEFGSIAG